MSGIYIPNMKMPTYCDACPFCVFTLCLINTLQEGKYCVTHSCPLVAVPDHGRLIDADALLESIKEAKKKQPEISDVYDEDYFAVAEWVSYAPTIIESEE